MIFKLTTIKEMATDITVPKIKLKQVTLPKLRYYEDPEGVRYPSATTVLKYFYEDDESYAGALQGYGEMLERLGINPTLRLRYTAWRGTLGHYLLTAVLARQARQPAPEFEIEGKDIRYCLRRDDVFDQPRWPLQEDLDHVVTMIGKFLMEHEFIPVLNGIEFMTISKKYEYAGTCDLFGYLDGILTILDIKTAWLLKYGQQDISPKRVAKYEAQVSAYDYAVQEMLDYTIKPAQRVILSICPDKFYPTRKRMINPELNYQLYKCKDRFDDFLENREKFRKRHNF